MDPIGIGDYVVSTTDQLFENFSRYHVFEYVLILFFLSIPHLTKVVFRSLAETAKCAFKCVGDIAEDYYRLQERLAELRSRYRGSRNLPIPKKVRW